MIPVILFVFADGVPEAEELLERELLPFPSRGRNGRYLTAPERCDGIVFSSLARRAIEKGTLEIPDSFRSAPSGEIVWAAHLAERKRELEARRASIPAEEKPPEAKKLAEKKPAVFVPGQGG